MNLDDYQTLFVVGASALILIAASPTLNFLFVPSGERFSELWLLSSEHTAGNYPFNIHEGEDQQLFVGVGNHLGFSAYYVVYVKFRNQTQSLPDTDKLLASSLPILYEFRFLVPKEKFYEVSMNFRILETAEESNMAVVRRMTINNETFSTYYIAKWDSEYRGFYYELFFELWLYNTISKSFEFHNRFVGIWLNITLSQQ